MISQEEKRDIRCSETGKLLAKRDGDALYIWCKECKKEHKVLLKDRAKESIEEK